MTTKMRQVSSTVHVRPPVTITDPDIKNVYEEALSPYFRDCRIRTDLDLIEAMRGMLTETAEDGHLTEQCLRHNTGFILGILTLGE
jgi:hypothetical protein